MLMRIPIFAFVAAVCLAEDTEKQHKALASQPTPREWHAGAVWRFVITPLASKEELQILTFRVTDRPGVSCTPGWKDVWRAFVVVQGHVPLLLPVYQVEGRALQINLSGNMCDGYDIIDGVLTGAEFRGERRTFGLGGSVVGTVRGFRVQR